MQYSPELCEKDIEENHRHFDERVSLYRGKGLDFVKSRDFILQKAHPLEGSMLEIGSGTGYTALALAKAGHKFASVDNDKEALNITALNLSHADVLSNVKLYVMDGACMTFESASFKNIICVNLFHHIDKVNKMLSEIDRVLCANGKVVLADFNRTGMKIVDAVHEKEGRMHKNSEVKKEDVYSYFSGLGYEIRAYEDNCHWLLVGIKKIER